MKIWNDCQKNLCKLTIKTSGKIEDEKEATLVDFANMFVGGGVLYHGFKLIFIHYY